MESLGNRLKLIRAGLRWSQIESARKIGIEQSYLSKLENDQALPSANFLEKICKGYGADVQQLLAGLDEQLLRRKPELLVLRHSPTRSLRQKAWWALSLPRMLAVVVALVSVGLAIAWKVQMKAELPAPEHELLSMKVERVDGRKVIEMFAEYGGLKVSGLELVQGEIEQLEIDQLPWDVALAQVAEKLGLRAKISGGYVTLVSMSAEFDETHKFDSPRR